MSKKSAGILLFRLNNGSPEVFLVHPGGPFFIKKDLGSWTIPKGEYDDNEQPLDAAKREFVEETGIAVDGTFITLAPVRQKSGKMVHAYALQSDIDPSRIQSNNFEMEWPPRSGKMRSFPEVDKGEWFDTDTAIQKIIPAQIALINELIQRLS